MISRRGFLINFLGTYLVMAMKPSPARSERTIIPGGARLDELVDKNPAEIDAALLDVTPIENFGVMGLEDYEASLEDWRLIVDGNVTESLKLNYPDILELPPIEKTVLLICPGVFAFNAVWKGISMKRLLDRAYPKAENGYVTIHGPQGNYEKVEKFSFQEVSRDKVFLAYDVNGVRLPKKHGFPLRVVAQDHYGSEWVKYVYKMTVHLETLSENQR
jgi:DMSO/TMAO reductase YedYZ molybdopterin-dependent catalytic subunit